MEDEPQLTYDSPRDEALHSLWRAGRDVESDGELGSFTGPFARVTNLEADLAVLRQTFGEQWHELGVEPRQLLGHFVLGHGTEGQALVMELRNEQAAILAYAALKKVHEEWKASRP